MHLMSLATLNDYPVNDTLDINLAWLEMKIILKIKSKKEIYRNSFAIINLSLSTLVLRHLSQLLI